MSSAFQKKLPVTVFRHSKPITLHFDFLDYFNSSNLCSKKSPLSQCSVTANHHTTLRFFSLFQSVFQKKLPVAVFSCSKPITLHYDFLDYFNSSNLCSKTYNLKLETNSIHFSTQLKTCFQASFTKSQSICAIK